MGGEGGPRSYGPTHPPPNSETDEVALMQKESWRCTEAGREQGRQPGGITCSSKETWEEYLQEATPNNAMLSAGCLLLDLGRQTLNRTDVDFCLSTVQIQLSMASSSTSSN